MDNQDLLSDYIFSGMDTEGLTDNDTEIMEYIFGDYPDENTDDITVCLNNSDYTYVNEHKYYSDMNAFHTSMLSTPARLIYSSFNEIEGEVSAEELREITWVKREYRRWVYWYASKHKISGIPLWEGLKWLGHNYLTKRINEGFICADWMMATKTWADSLELKYLGRPQERMWYLENFITIPTSRGHLVLDPFLFGPYAFEVRLP